MEETQTRSVDQMLARPEVYEVALEVAERKAARERKIARMRLLWEHRRFLWKVTFLGLLVAIAVAFLIPARYESTARLMPPENQSGTGMALMAALASKGSSALGMLAGDLLGMKSTGAVFLGILSSRTMQDRLISQFDLRHVYGERRWEDTRKKLAKHTDMSEDRISGIITITVSDHDPKRAAAMANAYIDGLNSMVANLSTSGARRERIFLEGRLEEVKRNLEDAENDFSQFASKNTAVNIPEQAKAMVIAAATLQGQLIAAQSELQALKQIYTDSNSRVRAAQARVEELHRALERIGGKSEGMEADPPDGDQSLYPSIRRLPLLGVAYADLFRQTKVEEAVFEALTQEYELAKVQEAKEIPTVKVLDAPNIPEKRSFPPRMVIVLLGILLSLGLGAASILSGNRWTSIDPQDPGKLLAQEVFSTLKAQLPNGLHNGSRWNLARKASVSPAQEAEIEKKEPD